jgi:outer membrane protein TolC
MKIGSVTVISLLLLSFFGEALADDRTVSLKEAVSLALTGNHEVRAFTFSVSAEGEDIGVARSFLLPKIAFEERFLRTNNPPTVFSMKLNQRRFAPADFEIDSLNNPAPINDFQTTFALEQALFTRKASVGLEMARTEFAAKSEDLTRKKEEIAFRVTQAYLATSAADEFVNAAEKALEDAREQVRLAELRHDTGLGLYSDTLRASTSLKEAEQRLVTAEKNRKVARRALGLVIGVEESLAALGGPPEVRLEQQTYYQEAASKRKDLEALRLRQENAKNSVRLAQSGYFPTLGLGGAYQLNDHRRPFGSEGDSWQLVAFLRWDLFDGARREHEVSKARFKVAETGEHLEGLRKAVSYKVYEAYLGVEETRKGLELARAALATAEEGRRLVRARYESSLAIFVDLLNAQANLDYTRANLAGSESAYLRSIANLAYESGTILRDLNIEQ